MDQNCIPIPDADKRDWLANYREKICVYGAKVDLETADVSAIDREITAFLTARESLSRMKESLHAAIVSLREQERALAEKIATQTRKVKASAHYSDQIGRQLGVQDDTLLTGSDTFRPSFSVAVENGCVRIDFTKGQADRVNIYARLRGQLTWNFVACDTNSPYIDCTPSSRSDHSEVREYLIRGVLGGDEFGEPSDVRAVSFGDLCRNDNPPSAKRVGRWA